MSSGRISLLGGMIAGKFPGDGLYGMLALGP